MKSYEFITEHLRYLEEKWSQKYKNSINCSHPKGFSQKAHCAGKRKHNESVEKTDQASVDALLKKHGWSTGRTANGDLAFTWQGSKYEFYGERVRITMPNGQSVSVVWGKQPNWQGRPGDVSFAQAVQQNYLAFDLPVWQALDRGQISDSQALQQFTAETERQAREAVAQGVTEGEVVPFRQTSKTLTWQQVPKDILLLANDWFWASEDNSGLDSVIDPKGYGNGTQNDVTYITAKLQQKGWNIDYNDEYDGPGEFNLRLTNKRGQTVLLPIEDAQDFSGWAEGTSSHNLSEGPFVQRIVHPRKVSIFVRMNNRPPKIIATDVPYEILDKYIDKIIQKYPQFKPTDFSFKSSDKVS